MLPMVGDLFIEVGGHRETTVLNLIAIHFAETQNGGSEMTSIRSNCDVGDDDNDDENTRW